MGTSSSFGGQTGKTPLVPTWLQTPSEPGVNEPSPTAQGEIVPELPTTSKPELPPQKIPVISSVVNPNRFIASRNNFTRFATSGGRSHSSLRQAISHYVRTSTGGSRNAMQRLGAARSTGAKFVGFLTDVQNLGSHEALRALNLEGLVGKPIEVIFGGIMDVICPSGGSIDEGITRNAFDETIVDLIKSGLIDLDKLSSEQIDTALEIYCAHAIEGRILNDIGTRVITIPPDIHSIEEVQTQLWDFIRRGVSDGLAMARTLYSDLTKDQTREFVDSVYESAFEILQNLSDTEGNQ